jgi:hypothetical protein
MPPVRPTRNIEGVAVMEDYFLSAAAVMALLAFWLHSMDIALFSTFK